MQYEVMAQPESGKDLRPRNIKQCPDCGSVDTRVSRRQGLLTKVMKPFRIVRYKCKTCGRRFYSGV